MVRDAFARVENLHDPIRDDVDYNVDILGGANGDIEYVDPLDEEELIRDSTQPLYEGCPVNHLQATIIIMTLANLYGVFHIFLDELLSFICGDLLPLSNCLSRLKN